MSKRYPRFCLTDRDQCGARAWDVVEGSIEDFYEPIYKSDKRQHLINT